MLRELITFEVEGQVFGLDIMAIREIRAWSPTTRLPRVPSYVAGVVNLRGTVLPVIDLAARLGWRATEPTPRHASVLHGLLAPFGTGGNLVNDAHLAALAVEHRCTVVSYDGDFARFPGVNWEMP